MGAVKIVTVQRSSPGETFRVLLREANAIGRQSVLLPRRLTPRRVSLEASASASIDVVFLLHGVLATAGVFVPLEKRLKSIGVQHLASFTYHPFRSIASLSQELARACANIPERARLHIVGHSLGGIVARHYVQFDGGAERVRQTISLASPFFGTEVVRSLPGVIERLTPLVSELSPSSVVLEQLRDPHSIPKGVPHTSFVASGDMLVTPPTSAAFPHGDVVLIDGVGHNGMLFDETVAEQVCRRIVMARELDESLAAE